MQVSLAQMAADNFVGGIQNDSHTALEQALGEKFVEDLYGDHNGRLPVEYVSDWLHLWLLSGLAHQACRSDPLTYFNAIALVFVEFATNRGLFGAEMSIVPAMPTSLVTEDMSDDAAFVSSPMFLLPLALTPTGFELTRQLSKTDRRAAITAFVKHPEWYRHGIYSPGTFFPQHDATS